MHTRTLKISGKSRRTRIVDAEIALAPTVNSIGTEEKEEAEKTHELKVLRDPHVIGQSEFGAIQAAADNQKLDSIL